MGLFLALYSALYSAMWPQEFSLRSLQLCNDTGKQRCELLNNFRSTGKKFYMIKS